MNSVPKQYCGQLDMELMIVGYLISMDIYLFRKEIGLVRKIIYNLLGKLGFCF